jgi:hypothetical protein
MGKMRVLLIINVGGMYSYHWDLEGSVQNRKLTDAVSFDASFGHAGSVAGDPISCFSYNWM